MFSWTNVGIVIGVVTCVTGGLYLMERWIPPHRREKHNEVAGYIFAAIGVLYAVLMAFVTVTLLLIYELNYPFAGPGKIGPEAFQVFLARLPPAR